MEKTDDDYSKLTGQKLRTEKVLYDPTTHKYKGMRMDFPIRDEIENRSATPWYDLEIANAMTKWAANQEVAMLQGSAGHNRYMARVLDPVTTGPEDSRIMSVPVNNPYNQYVSGHDYYDPKDKGAPGSARLVNVFRSRVVGKSYMQQKYLDNLKEYPMAPDQSFHGQDTFSWPSKHLSDYAHSGQAYSGIQRMLASMGDETTVLRNIQHVVEKFREYGAQFTITRKTYSYTKDVDVNILYPDGMNSHLSSYYLFQDPDAINLRTAFADCVEGSYIAPPSVTESLKDTIERQASEQEPVKPKPKKHHFNPVRDII